MKTLKRAKSIFFFRLQSMSAEGVQVRYIDIENSFQESNKHNIKTTNINDFKNWLKNEIGTYGNKTKITSKVSRFEIIGNNCIPYFDIEGIPKDKGEIFIITIANNLMKTMSEHSKHKFSRYCITQNLHSLTHEGKSYHVYFPEFRTFRDEMKKFINHYVDMKLEGYEYIDTSVYSRDRLFRLPYQKGVNKTKNLNSIERRQIDYHFIIRGPVDPSNYIISNVEGKEMISFSNIPQKYAKMKSKNTISGPYNAAMEKMDKVCDLLTLALTKYEDKEKNKEMKTDEDYYNKSLALRELMIIGELKAKYEKILNEFIDYYETNKTYDDFRLPRASIDVILIIIESKI